MPRVRPPVVYFMCRLVENRGKRKKRKERGMYIASQTHYPLWYSIVGILEKKKKGGKENPVIITFVYSYAGSTKGRKHLKKKRGEK